MKRSKNALQGAAEVPAKILNHAFISVFIINMLLNLSKQMTNTLIAKYVDSLGASAMLVGIVTSMFAVTALVFKVFAGPAIDTYNKKYILSGAMFIMAAAYFGYGLSDTISSLMVFRLLQGAGQAFTATCCLALAADVLPADQFGAGIGYFSLAQVICQTIGPSVGLWLSEALGYRPTFMLAAALMAMAAVMALQVRLDHQRGKPFHISIGSIIAADAVFPSFLMMLLTAAYASINSFLVIYAYARGVNTNIGLFFTVYSIAMLFTRPLHGRLTDRLGFVKSVLPSLGFFALSFLLISSSTSLWMFLFAAVVSAFGYGTCQPAVQALCMKSAGPGQRGAASSTNYIGDDLGNLLSPIIAGVVADRLGYAAMWRIMVVPVAAAALLVFAARKRIRRIETGFRDQNAPASPQGK